ncbi:DUF4249 domain-containing protein [Hymenobacter swuensis]|uniref:DUF4249 domain-containing protein n=1 Tax=Hymenobacter swuensis TaxID=1446467 RepID=UPI000694C8FD|nr:DUF4249 domain-containing protein [Hymenobacter swuensis]
MLVLSGCIEPFEPEVEVSKAGFLVVDGSLNGAGRSTIRLSRTTALRSSAKAQVESKARVYMEEEGGQQYLLPETVAGTYVSAAVALPPGTRVRLHFTTAGQREYVSDYTELKATPPIDSVTWKAGSRGVQIAVNAHDDTQQSRFYRWDYTETWEFTSAYKSVVEYRNRAFYPRAENIYNCWGTEEATAIKLGTTSKLGQDVVSEQPLTLLPPTSVKLRYRYSILVRQYALSSSEYSYWEALRKNTETQGNLFDPLPTQLTGNVHAVVDAGEQVIGFIGAQSVTEKRIFIGTRQLPQTWVFDTGYETCMTDTIPRPNPPLPPPPPPPTEAQALDYFDSGLPFPIDVLHFATSPRNFYLYSTADCVDCRRRGTNVKPSFW